MWTNSNNDLDLSNYLSIQTFRSKSVENANASFTAGTEVNRGKWGAHLIGGALALGALLAASGGAQAQSSMGPVPLPADGSLTLHGVTLYGIVDVGLQYESHGAPFSD